LSTVVEVETTPANHEVSQLAEIIKPDLSSGILTYNNYFSHR